MNQETKTCQSCKNHFVIEPEDFNFYEKIKVPPPTFCPECRNQRRMSWRTERSLFKRQCNAPGHTESIISMYDPQGPYKVYDSKYWWSDAWDPLGYGRDFDPTVPFLKQFSNLLKDIPLIALSNINSVNSDYTNFVAMNKNCYLCFGAGLNENVSYSNKALECRDSQDLMTVTRGELCYECVNCQDVYRLAYSDRSKNCTDSYFLYNCRDCNNCFGCTNLVSKSYCIFNQQYTKDEYVRTLKEFNISNAKNLAKFKKKFEELKLSSFHKYANIIGSTKATGDNIANAKNCLHCFDIFENVEDSKFLYSALRLKDSYDGNGIYQTQLSYEMVDSNDSNGSIATVTVYDSTDARYSFNCHGCTDIFGCVNLRNKQYCILNKQYSKEQYKDMVIKIQKQMKDVPYRDAKGRVYNFGDFFPAELSPWAYHETIAYEYFPLDEASAKNEGFAWKNFEHIHPAVTKRSEELPDNAGEVTAAWANEVIACEHEGKCNHLCTNVFKFIPQEIDFYRRLNLPFPHLCPNCRHFERLKQRNPLKLWPDHCECSGKESVRGIYKNTVSHSHADAPCSNGFETPYPPGHPQILYCEQCYQREVA